MNETSSKRAMASWKWLQRKSHLAAVCLQHPSINKGDPITSWPLFVPCQSIYPEAHHSQQKLESTSQTGADFWFASNMNDKQRWNAEKTTYDNSGSAGLHVLQVPCQSGLETTLLPLQKKNVASLKSTPSLKRFLHLWMSSKCISAPGNSRIRVKWPLIKARISADLDGQNSFEFPFGQSL